MLVKRIVIDWHVQFLTLTGLLDYHEYDLGGFGSGEWIIYKDNKPKYLFDLYYDDENFERLRDFYLRSGYFSNFEQLVKCLGDFRRENLTSQPKRPIALPIKGLFKDSIYREVNLELFLLDFDQLKPHLPVIKLS